MNSLLSKYDLDDMNNLVRDCHPFRITRFHHPISPKQLQELVLVDIVLAYLESLVAFQN